MFSRPYLFSMLYCLLSSVLLSVKSSVKGIAPPCEVESMPSSSLLQRLPQSALDVVRPAGVPSDRFKQCSSFAESVCPAEPGCWYNAETKTCNRFHLTPVAPELVSATEGISFDQQCNNSAPDEDHFKIGLGASVAEDFAVEPHLKFFTYDRHKPDTWAPLDGLKTCLEGRSVDGWKPELAGHNLFTVHRKAYEELSAFSATNFSQWENGTYWLEQGPFGNGSWMHTNDTVFFTNPDVTSPMSFYHGWMSQPCNSLSNGAYYEIALDACSLELPDDVKTFATALGGIQAFGSFAMHSNPLSRETGAITKHFDEGAISVVLYYLLQLAAEKYIVDRAPTHDYLLKLGNLSYDNASEAVKTWTLLMVSPKSDWPTIIPKVSHIDHVPDFLFTVGVLILVQFRSIFNADLLGKGASDAVYIVLCGVLIPLLSKRSGKDMSGEVCSSEGNTAKAIRDATFRVPIDVGRTLSDFVDTLELLVESLFWEEENLLGNPEFLDQWTAEGTVWTRGEEGDCWRMPHASWHRISAQAIRKFLRAIATVDGTTIIPPMSKAQKNNTWHGIREVFTPLMVLVRTASIIKDSRKVNVCEVFKLAKEGGSEEGGVHVYPHTDFAKHNASILTQLTRYGVSALNDTLKKYFEEYQEIGSVGKILMDELSGFNALEVTDFDVNFLERQTFPSTGSLSASSSHKPSDDVTDVVATVGVSIPSLRVRASMNLSSFRWLMPKDGVVALDGAIGLTTRMKLKVSIFDSETSSGAFSRDTSTIEMSEWDVHEFSWLFDTRLPGFLDNWLLSYPLSFVSRQVLRTGMFRRFVESRATEQLNNIAVEAFEEFQSS